jgi:DNA-binding CsgD family transcriptional regulator
LILGRDAELAEVVDFVETVASGPAVLILEGPAGIGKTTLWQEGVDCGRGRGFRTLYCRAAESETQLSYAGLGDLLDLELPELPAPQTAALNAALLRGVAEHPPPDQRAVSVASLGVFRALAAEAPLLIAIDDVQWLDPPSARVLSFVVRRLESEPVRILLALRPGVVTEPLGLGPRSSTPAVGRLFVGPLDSESTTRLLRERTGQHLAHPILQRVHQVSDGNPFFALEIAAALARRNARTEPGQPLPVPEDLKDLLNARLSTLPSTVVDVLLVVAAAGRATEDLVVAAAGEMGDVSAALASAERARIIRRSGRRIGFGHPLLESSVYSRSSVAARRRTHERLAGVVDDPEEQARHLALAAPHPDANVAGALDRAARHARSRGAPDAAAELAELARKLTPPEDPRAILRRNVEAAEHHFDAGDAARATVLLEEAIASATTDGDRAKILFRLASISWLDIPRVQGLAEQALAEAGGEPELVASVHEHLAWVGIYRGDLDFASAHARASVDVARTLDEPSIRADSLATFGMVEFLLGRGAEEHMAEAVRSQDLGALRHPGTQATIYTAARTCYGLQLLWAGRLDDARKVLLEEMSEYERRGRYVVRDELHCYLAELECRAGNWDAAAAHAREAVEIGEDSGHFKGRGSMLFPRALVAALRGEIKAARSDAEEGVRISLGNKDLLSVSCNRAVLGFLELSQARYSEAMTHLQLVLSFLESMGTEEPCIIPCTPDAIEALVSLGRLEEAEHLTGELQQRGLRRGRPWAVATASRGRGLLCAARGDLQGARAFLDDALARHEEIAQPFERARTLLVKGEVERRAKQKRAARSSFDQARALFEALGAPLWERKASDGLARVGGQRGSSNELTPTERRVAELVAEGKRNREVADRLFISVKTVEANLSRAFHKLGVRSRTELAAQIRSRTTRPG